MPAVANGLVYSPDVNTPAGYGGWVLNASTGTAAGAGTYSADNPSAFTRTTRLTLLNATLRALSLTDSATLWSFTGDGQLTTSPIIVNNYVFIGSSTGKLYAVDATSGQQLWEQNLSGPLPAGNSARDDSIRPPSGLAAGDGLLIVPAGNTVSAFVLSTQP